MATSIFNRTLRSKPSITSTARSFFGGNKTSPPVAHSQLIKKSDQNNYLYKIQFQKVIPSLHQEYKDLYAEYLPKICSPEDRKEHVGSFMTWYGAQDEAIHLWRYKGNYDAHKFSNSSKAKSVNPDYIKFREERGKMLKSRRNDLIFEFGFCPQIRDFTNSASGTSINACQSGSMNKVYEFRQYELKPGRLSDWNAQWIQVFRNSIRGAGKEGFVGGFFTDIGKLNTIYYVWAYDSLEDRQVARNEAWKHEEWGNVVSETQSCCRNMSSQIMLPMDIKF